MKKKYKDISMIDMVIYICQRWRSLIICLVIGAVVFGVYGWWNVDFSEEEKEQIIMTKEFKKSVESANKINGVPLDQINWEEVLRPEQIDFVEEGVAYWKRFKEIQAAPENPVNPESKEVYISKWTYYTNEINAKLTLQSYLDKFSENQKKYFNFLTNNDIEQNENIHSEHLESNKIISIKYLILGAFVGLIIAAIVLAIKYVATKTIKTIFDLEEGFGFQILGVFDSETEFDKKHKTKFDKALRKARRKNKQRLDFNDNVELTATKIQLAAEKSNLSKICLISNSENDCNIMEEIVKKLSDKLNIIVIKNVLAKADALQDMAKMEGAILVEQIDISTDKDIEEEYLLCSKYGINIIGAVVLE